MLVGKAQIKTQNRTYNCAGATIKVNLTLNPPPPLPSAFYWVLVLPILFLLGAYLARHPRMRSFMVRLMLAWRAVKSSNEEVPMQKVVETAVETVSKTAPAKSVMDTVKDMIQSKVKPKEEDRH